MSSVWKWVQETCAAEKSGDRLVGKSAAKVERAMHSAAKPHATKKQKPKVWRCGIT